MWRLYGANGDDKDYEISPFVISVVDKVFSKFEIAYRYMPNQLTVSDRTHQYDPCYYEN